MLTGIQKTEPSINAGAMFFRTFAYTSRLVLFWSIRSHEIANAMLIGAKKNWLVIVF
jgi:hypothetical protein